MTQEQIDITLKVKDLYLKYGIKSVTMDDVSRECGISKKTLYQYFADKTELVEAVISNEMKIGKEAMSNILAKNYDAIEEMFHIHKFMDSMARQHSHVTEYDLKKYYPAIFTNIINFKREEIYNIWKMNIEKGKNQGFYRQEVNTEIISKTNLLRFESSIDTCIFTLEELLSYDFFAEILSYHIRGIATAEGIARFEEIQKLTSNK